MEIGEWLNALDLGRFEARFREQEIDFDVLPDLTDADLEKIGVPLGARKRLMKAIATLAPPEVPLDAAASIAASGTRGFPLASAEGERRPITVMFCDLVGSTSLAANLDPEDWRNLVGAYLDQASAAVTGLGGHVLKKLGDGLMALFGYPHAQENDAERAARAALAIQRALAELNLKNAGAGAPQLAARIGLESGPVVVDATGEVFGEAPNIAARVQSLAEPGAVLVTARVQRQIAGLFMVEDKGAFEVRGVREPVTLYRLVRASGAGRRIGARAITPLVGRREDLDLLLRRWERARGGEGRLVQIVGEPGLGKSRLVEEFRARIAETPHSLIEWSASQLLQNTPLHPIAEWGRQRFGGPDASAERRAAEVKSALSELKLDPAEFAPLVAPLLDASPLDASPPPGAAASLPPEELRRQQLAAIVDWIAAGARTQPVLLVFEDLQWADPTSIDLLRALAERGDEMPLLIVTTARPEFRPPWSVRPHHSLVSLTPLARAEVRMMIGRLAQRHALSVDVIEGVSERSGGVPLFIEEVTRLLLERGVQGGVQAIPPTLQQSLAARLDRLGEARETAQIGAVLGREFSHSLLSSVAGLEEAELRSALEQLAEADILIVSGGDGPQATYRFKHALIQDAAYDSLLKSRRQPLHRRAAEILRDSALAEPEAIAHHFTQAGLDDLAIEWWGKAGDAALRRSAFQEAIAHLGKAIAMADKAGGQGGPASDFASRRRVRLQSDYAQAVMWSKGFVAEETKDAFARVRELAAQAGDATERFVALNGQWVRFYVHGEFRAAREAAETFLRQAEMEGRPIEAGVARRVLGLTCLFEGDFLTARLHLERTLREYVPERDREPQFQYGLETGASASAYLGLVAWHLGEVDRARALMDEAVARARDVGHVATIVNVHAFKTMLEARRDDPSAALNAVKVQIELSREHGMALYTANGELHSCWARGRFSDPATEAKKLRPALTAYIEQGIRVDGPFFYGALARLEAAAGNGDAALGLIDDALRLTEETNERWSAPLLHRLRGEFHLKRDPSASGPAEEAFRKALDVAGQQGARSSGLRAALALARLYRANNRDEEARAVLAPALQGFTQTQEMPEIAEADRLLAALA